MLTEIKEQSMVPMVIIREHNEENQAMCHLYAHTENRTANGTNGYDQRT